MQKRMGVACYFAKCVGITSSIVVSVSTEPVGEFLSDAPFSNLVSEQKFMKRTAHA